MFFCAVKDVHKNIATNYKSLTSITKKAKTKETIVEKIESIHTAETSFMLTIYFLFAVTCYHFFAGDPNKIYHHRPITEASLGSQRLYELVSECNINTFEAWEK